MKAFKNLFIKEDETETVSAPPQKTGFPVTDSSPSFSSFPSPQSQNTETSPYLGEIIEVYEKGLQSINMPGYDFYDFYLAIKAAGSQNEAIFKMAFQMGKTMDGNITPQKLVADAEYYISKINEVYRTYADQGKQKLDSFDKELHNERQKLSSEASFIETDLNNLRQKIVVLEKQLSDTKTKLHGVDHTYKPQQDVIRQKLSANDQAMHVCVQKLNSVKESILNYLR